MLIAIDSDYEAASANAPNCRRHRLIKMPSASSLFANSWYWAGVEIVRTPFRASQANSVAERFVRTVRSECLDWLLILNQEHLERVLTVFVDHYERPPPSPSAVPQAIMSAMPDTRGTGRVGRAPCSAA
jgi:transposase InsO family protein